MEILTWSIPLFLYFIGVCVIFFLNLKRRGSFRNISCFILLWWVFSALSSLFFYYFYFPILPSLSTEAIIYYFIGFVIITYPVTKFNEDNITKIDTTGCNVIISNFCILLGLMSIPPLLENMIFIVSNSGGSSSFMEEGHELLNSDEGYVTNMSYISLKLNNIASHFMDIYGLLICFCLSVRNNKKALIFILIALAGQIVGNLAHGSRASILYILMTCGIAYKIWYQQYDEKHKKTINKMAIIVVASIVSILTIITVTRFSVEKRTSTSALNVTNDQYVWASNSLYFGEAPVRLSGYAWDLKEYAHGQKMFSNVVGYFDGNRFNNISEHRNWIEKTCGIIYPQVFYGVAGEAYIDFGLWGGVLFLLIFGYIMQLFFRIRGSVKFYQLIPVCILLKVAMFSIMFFPYCNSRIIDLLYMALLYFYLRNKQKSYK